MRRAGCRIPATAPERHPGYLPLDADDLGLLVHHVIDEAGILVAADESVLP